MEYVVIFEKGENSYGASFPDLPGCIAVAKTMAEVKELIAGESVFVEYYTINNDAISVRGAHAVLRNERGVYLPRIGL